MTSGEVIWIEFPGVVQTKRRPAVVLSSAAYHAVRPDVIVGLITSQTAKANTPTDFLLQEWRAAACAFRQRFALHRHAPAAPSQHEGTLARRLEVVLARLTSAQTGIVIEPSRQSASNAPHPERRAAFAVPKSCRFRISEGSYHPQATTPPRPMNQGARSRA